MGPRPCWALSLPGLSTKAQTGEPPLREASPTGTSSRPSVGGEFLKKSFWGMGHGGGGGPRKNNRNMRARVRRQTTTRRDNGHMPDRRQPCRQTDQQTATSQREHGGGAALEESAAWGKPGHKDMCETVLGSLPSRTLLSPGGTKPLEGGVGWGSGGRHQPWHAACEILFAPAPQALFCF